MKVTVTNEGNKVRQVQKSVDAVGPAVVTLGPGGSHAFEFDDEKAGKAYVDHLKRYGLKDRDAKSPDAAIAFVD